MGVPDGPRPHPPYVAQRLALRGRERDGRSRRRSIRRPIGGGCAMAKYLLKVRYTGEGLAGVMKDGGTARRAVAEDLAKNLGGSLETFHFAFGDVDAYCIADLPDNKAAATLAMTVSATGRVSITTV